MQIKYQNYEDAENIPEKYLRQLFDLQSVVWWEKPYWEYKICDNTGCRRVYSIEDIHPKKTNNELRSWDDFCCIECESSTSFMYKSEEFYQLVKDYIKWNVSMVLMLWSWDTVEWFGVMSQWTVESISNFEFQTRPWGLSPNDIVSELSQKIFWVEDASENELVCFHQIYVSREVRDAAISYKLMQELFFQMWDVYSDLPVVWETRYDWKFYPVSRSMWFEDVVSDKYWYVIQSIDKYSDVLRFLWENDWFSAFQWPLLHFKKLARKIMQQSDVSQIAYYKE